MKATQKPHTKTVYSLDALGELLNQMPLNEIPQAPTDRQRAARLRDAHNEYRNPTHLIVSTIAYLIGVDRKHFENPNEPPLLSIFEQLDQSKDNRILRELCMLRTALEQNYMAIVRAFRSGLNNIDTLPELIPSDVVKSLIDQGIRLYRGKPDIDAYIVFTNIEISNRISKAACLFPEWLKWNYVKPIFLMPSGTKIEGIKAAGALYNSDRDRYPYKCWLNWDAVSSGTVNRGNILYNDEKFVTLLYERHEERLENLSLVRDAGNRTMRNLSALLDKCTKCMIAVDCENSDAIKMAAALSSLAQEQLDKIHKIILFDSEHTTPQWSTVVDRTLRLADPNASQPLDIEHIIVKRVTERKSQVDMTLAVRASKEVYMNGVDAIILVSSDSDYWALIQQLDSVRFLVMLEKAKAGLPILDTLNIHDIPFCFIDDFCTSASYSIKTATLTDAIQADIDRALHGELDTPLNVRTMMDAALRYSWITMSDREKDDYCERYLRRMKINGCLYHFASNFF